MLNGAAISFRKRFVTLILLTWFLPAVIGISYLVYIQLFTLDQISTILTTPLKPIYLFVTTAGGIWYFWRYIDPVLKWLSTPEQASADAAIKVIQGFPLRYWSCFLGYLLLAAVFTIVSGQIYTDFTASPVTWFRILLVCLIMAILVGLPVFFRIYDLFGEVIGGLELKRTQLTVRTKVFLIGALTPLLIDTMLVQYYWTRTGFFNIETFIIWLGLEGIAVVGALLFVHSFGNSLKPLQAVMHGEQVPLQNLVPRSTDELGVLTNEYRELLGRQERYNKILQYSNDLLRARENAIGPEEVCRTVVKQVRIAMQAERAYLVEINQHNAKANAWRASESSVCQLESVQSANDLIWINQVLQSCSNTPSVRRRGETDMFQFTEDGDNKSGVMLVHCLNISEHSVGALAVVYADDKKTFQENETLVFSGLVKETNNNLDTINRQQYEQHILHEKELAERMNQAKSAFISRMSHELRTPMNAILGFAQVMRAEQDPKLSSAHLDHIHEILSAGNHLMHLINDILDLAKIEAGKLKLSPVPTELSDIILESQSILTPLAQQSGVELVCPDTDNMDTLVLVDRVRTMQAIINLINNGIKFNHEGGRVEVSITTAEDNKIRISVADTGMGIAKKYHDKVFSGFERLDSTEDIEGSGIGLMLTKELVEVMNGNIGFESELGKGSQFWVELPMAQERRYEQRAKATDELQDIGSLAQQDKKILYIEDNRTNLKLVRTLMHRLQNVTFLEASTGHEGLALARTHKPDLILLDIHLPDINGYKVLAALRGDILPEDIPIIALSADVLPENMSKARALGFNDYITKPIDLDEFYTKIKQYLTNSELSDIMLYPS